MKRFKYIFNRDTLVYFYKSLVRPILEYACIIFDNCTIKDQNLIESIQLEAARVCTGALWNTCKVKLLDELGWEPLSVRRAYHKLVMFYKILNQMTPSYLISNQISMISDITTSYLRNSSQIRTLRARTNMYKFSFFSINN